MIENKTFHITTFGCQMNEHDSETLAGMLLAKGYQSAPERKDANIVIFNTCSVRENADGGELYCLRLRLHDAAAACR